MPDSDSTPSPAATPETVLWTGHTSQWVHAVYYFVCLAVAIGCGVAAALWNPLAAAGVVVPLVFWVIRWVVTMSTLYELTTQRLKITSGVLNRKLDELELYRVKDYTLEQPLLLRLLGLGNLTLVTSDASNPRLTLAAIPGAKEVREQLRTAVQNERDRKRVRELDVDGNDSALT